MPRGRRPPPALLTHLPRRQAHFLPGVGRRPGCTSQDEQLPGPRDGPGKGVEMEHAVRSDETGASTPLLDDRPSLASEMRASALLFGLAGAVVGGALLLTRVLGA